MPSSQLIDAIDRIDPIPYVGDLYRHVAAGRHPLSGAGARSLGGRWNPPQSFATLYLADRKATVEAEFRRMARRQGLSPGSFLPRRLYRLGCEGILAPSAAGDGKVLAVFIDRLMPDSRVDDFDFEVWTESS